MTNGEKMQEVFPEGKTRRCRNGVVFESDGWCHAMILTGGTQNIKNYQDNHDLSFMQIGLAEIAKVHTVQTAKNILHLYMAHIIFALTVEQI